MENKKDLEIEKLKKENKRLKEKVRKLKEDCYEERKFSDDYRIDRNKYRQKVVEYFKWFVEMHGENQTPDLAWAILDLAKMMNKTDSNFSDW